MGKSLLERLGEDSELIAEGRLLPRVELNGNTEAVVDGYKSIIEYDCAVVRLDCGRLRVRFCGDGLSIRNLTLERLAISGCITGVDFSC